MEAVSPPGSAITSTPAPPAGAAHDVVILRESEHSEGLARAIARVRADARTARSRILIIAPDGGPDPAEAPARLAPVGLRARCEAAAHAVERVGARIAPLVSDLDRLVEECEREAGELAEDVGESARARLQHRAKIVAEILTWIRAVAGDLDAAARAACGRRQVVELADLAAEAFEELGREEGCTVRFLFSRPGAPAEVEIDAASAADLVSGAARLVAARIGGAGRIVGTVESTPAEHLLRLAGDGEVTAVRAASLVDRVVELASDLGVALRPDPEHGSEGAAVVLAFPRRAD
ncbi:MAG TPA: hypothetical protein VK081_13335 [Planctomycetota bacterium]|nr:hypothetical protein [Planctomycetota bacterium]